MRLVAFSPDAGPVLVTPLPLVTVVDYDRTSPRPPRWSHAQAWARSRSGGWHVYAPPGVALPRWADAAFYACCVERGEWHERPCEVAWVTAGACAAVLSHCERMTAFAEVASATVVRWTGRRGIWR